MEEKKLEQNDEVIKPVLEDEVTQLLEPTPYHNKYKNELDKEALPKKNALLMLKIRCLRKDMTTLNAITILQFLNIKMRFLNLNLSLKTQK